MTIKDLKKGEYFTLRPVEEPKASQVWVRGEYDRSARKYEIFRFSDVSATLLMRKDVQVYTDFTF